jgi:hypothetical protein
VNRANALAMIGSTCSRAFFAASEGARNLYRMDSLAAHTAQARPMLMRSPLARERRSPAGFIRPAQPVLADGPPTGPGWSFEIKHDG